MCDCERPEFYEQSNPRSRRVRRCYECDRLIDVGQRYSRTSGKWSGSFESIATCLDCERISAWLGRRIDCCISFGELADMLACERLTWAEASELSQAAADGILDPAGSTGGNGNGTDGPGVHRQPTDRAD
jgi:hypothetical protein